MKLFIVCTLLLAGLGAPAEASQRSLLQGSTQPPKQAPKPTAPPKAQESAKGRTAPTGTAKNTTKTPSGQGARDGLGKFDFLSPDSPPIRTSTNPTGHRRSLQQNPAQQPKQSTPAAAAPKGNEKSQATGSTTAKAPPKTQESAKGRTAPTGTAKNTTKTPSGQGARDGLGKFDFLSPDSPPIRTSTNPTGRRRALLQNTPAQQPKPATTTAAAPKTNEKSQATKSNTSTTAPPKTQGRTAPTGTAKNTTKTPSGQGARDGLGKFDFLSPDSPPIRTSTNPTGHRRALLQNTPAQQPKPATTTAAGPKTNEKSQATKSNTSTTAPPKTQGRTAPTGTAKNTTKTPSGQGARDGLGKFDFLSPDSPPIRTSTNPTGRR